MLQGWCAPGGEGVDGAKTAKGYHQTAITKKDKGTRSLQAKPQNMVA